MFPFLSIRRLRHLCSRLRWSIPRRRSRPKVQIKKLGKPDPAKPKPKPKPDPALNGSCAAAVHPNGGPSPKVRVATFNAALFSMAPAVPKPGTDRVPSFDFDCADGGLIRARLSGEITLQSKSMNDNRPKSILKQSPLHPSSAGSPDHLTRQQKFARSRLRVSINLPDNEISLLRSRQVSFREDGTEPYAPSSLPNGSSSTIGRILRGKAPATRASFRNNDSSSNNGAAEALSYRSTRSVLEVLRELDADILALQHVKAEEEKEMKPLSDLAAALGMNYVFAESWAPEYGNAVLSKWPIRRWKAQKIFDDTDFRLASSDMTSVWFGPVYFLIVFELMPVPISISSELEIA
ncbi:hypothetical protein CDL15_Pgr018492 [Punica granatum]|uniref:Endonuclease/exonuclease/phosphatase domain-containing protein n=1 Tax=Punica granatum TaxID=22663 RepID=A0A218WZ50_PUNGR|nr:hypothetical protein CDL15_Pgr018492 [Punica granatum]PKI74304.1 hypothetical protein CRG98_005280 [Punica granatum]